MDNGEIPAMEAYEIITRAYPFRDLSVDQFEQVVREMGSNRVIWIDEEKDTLEKRQGTWQYFYQNLSMIPDEATYDVEGRGLGQPDRYPRREVRRQLCHAGEVFIQRGEMWRITEIDEEEETVTVSPIEDPAGEVPSWVGQEIPVPPDVAREVGELRRVAGSQLQGGASTERVAKDLENRYDAEAPTITAGLEQLESTRTPSPRTRTSSSRCAAARPSSTPVSATRSTRPWVGRCRPCWSARRLDRRDGGRPLSHRTRTSQGPQRRRRRRDSETTDPDHVEAIIELSLKNSDALKFKLAQVAAKFGTLKRWRGKGSTSFGRNRLASALEDTPIYDEAVREVFHEDLAVEATKEVLRDIQDGTIGLETVGDRTPIGLGGKSSSRELLSPEHADASVIQTVRERIQDDRVILCCLHCQDWQRTTTVSRVRDQPDCPDCGSTRIAALNPGPTRSSRPSSRATRTTSRRR